MGHKFVAGKSPGDWGNAESQRCGIPYVRFMLQRFHFCEPPHSVSCVGCKGSHGDQGVAHEPKLSPPTSLFFCTSAFCEKENPEETTFPYRRTLSINGTWGMGTPRDSSYASRFGPSADTKSHTCMAEQGRSVGPLKLTAAGS